MLRGSVRGASHCWGKLAGGIDFSEADMAATQQWLSASTPVLQMRDGVLGVSSRVVSHHNKAQQLHVTGTLLKGLQRHGSQIQLGHIRQNTTSHS